MLKPPSNIYISVARQVQNAQQEPNKLISTNPWSSSALFTLSTHASALLLNPLEKNIHSSLTTHASSLLLYPLEQNIHISVPIKNIAQLMSH